MFILCNENEAAKKQLKNNHKILVSHHLQDIDETETISHLTQLIPSVGLIKSFINGDISKKKYIRKYIKSIENDDELFASLIMLILAHENSSKNQEKRVISIVVSQDEFQFGYIQALLEYIQEKFNIPFMYYREWKKRDFKCKKYNINQEELSRNVKKYKTILFDSYDDYKDTKKSLDGKSNKKKKSKDKKKDKEKDKKKYKDKSDKKKKDKKSKKKEKKEYSANFDKETEFEFKRLLSKKHVIRVKKLR